MPSILKSFLYIFQESFYFLPWWYSRGLWELILRNKDFLLDKEKKLGVGIWVKNIFTPMYGQRDWTSRFISFFIRLFQIIFRSLLIIFWALYSLLLILLWLILPPLIIYEIIFQLFL